MSDASPKIEPSRARGLCSLLVGLALACGRQDGVVGVQPLDAVSMAGAPTSPLGFSDEFADNPGIWQEQAGLPGASSAFGQANTSARDHRLAELRFPGHPEYAADDQVGPDYMTQIATDQRFHFGTYRTRVGFGSCAPSEEAVMAFLGYFNDGQDHDGDGIVDDLEIDMQVTCSAPNRVYLTVFTDDEETAQGSVFRKLSRVVDFTTGELFDTQKSDSETFTAAGSDPSLQLPDVFSAGALYEVGFEWHADSLRFFLSHAGADHDLWTLTGSERVPQLPVYITYNIWHPASHWYPDQGAADYPASDVVLLVDWVSFTPE